MENTTDGEQPQGFFAVDWYPWTLASNISLDVGLAFLVLACSSGHDHRTTKWSAHSVRKYTGMRWEAAEHSIKALERHGVIKQIESGNYPRYRLPLIGTSPLWLPNSLVTSENLPLRCLRMTRNVETVRMLFILYETQNLEDGGISRDYARHPYTRTVIRQPDRYSVVAFAPGDRIVHDIAGRSFNTLEEMGFTYWEPHVVQPADDPNGDILFSLGPDSYGRSVVEVADGLLIRSDHAYARRHHAIVLPFPSYMPDNIGIVGIAQLRHRQQTKLTASWRHHLTMLTGEWSERYHHMRHQFIGRQSAGTRDFDRDNRPRKKTAYRGISIG